MATERRRNAPAMPEEYEPPRRVSSEEYQRLDEQLPGKYEYHDGLMYPRYYPPGSHWSMAGGTEAHVQIILRLLVALALHVGNHGPCRVYPSDMKLKAGTNEYYPDAYVVCNEPMQPDRRKLEDAVLICEVRSKSTAKFDQGDKFKAYTQLPSLREYLLLDNRRRQALLYRKSDDGDWLDFAISAEAEVPLESVGLRLPLASLYDGLTLDTE
ncbi:MAG TPA: Uma2 family endonuclease [Chloroflexota bacterium]|jgi:Uma2 family endonuclease|nr:Uma2 family endonuclease [Chloroflexota bacterium]